MGSSHHTIQGLANNQVGLCWMCSKVSLCLPWASFQAYLEARGMPAPKTIVDVGCSTGISSRWLERAFPDAEITGLDLSTYFLAVAEREER